MLRSMGWATHENSTVQCRSPCGVSPKTARSRLAACISSSDIAVDTGSCGSYPAGKPMTRSKPTSPMAMVNVWTDVELSALVAMTSISRVAPSVS